jgi:tetratricopeptide (TPR) repeat protein
MEHHPGEREGWELYVKAAVEVGKHPQALAALQKLQPTPDRDPELVVLQVRAMEGSGQQDRARALAKSLAMLHPELESVVALAKAPAAPAGGVTRKVTEPHGADPLVTVSRAEQYAAMGRIDRAVRTYRRLIFENPREWSLQERLEELLGRPHEPRTEDLSEELPNPDLVPPDVRMPSPYDDEDEITAPQIDLAEIRRQLEEANRPSEEEEAAAGRKLDLLDEDDVTDPGDLDDDGKVRRRDSDGVRRRRSLLGRKEP